MIIFDSDSRELRGVRAAGLPLRLRGGKYFRAKRNLTSRRISQRWPYHRSQTTYDAGQSQIAAVEPCWEVELRSSLETPGATAPQKLAMQPRLSCMQCPKHGRIFPSFFSAYRNPGMISKGNSEDCLAEWGSKIIKLRLATRGLGCIASLASFYD